ncbi:hypothetical protein [Klebsiella michiganensis]|uniref:hypothetical protein n=1 Tax=Klebsiella michiganensis TaxID=1134687 RepID=UPI003F503C0A
MGFFGMLMKVFNPKYQLILTDKDERDNDIVYVFKQYGSHDVFRVTYADILDNQNLLCSIHPMTIAEIAESETLRNKPKYKKIITKEIQGNHYEIGGIVYSGMYVCNNIDMFFDLNVADVCHIAHSTGFFAGRELTKKMANIKKKEVGDEGGSKIIELKSVQRKMHSDS